MALVEIVSLKCNMSSNHLLDSLQVLHGFCEISEIALDASERRDTSCSGCRDPCFIDEATHRLQNSTYRARFSHGVYKEVFKKGEGVQERRGSREVQGIVATVCGLYSGDIVATIFSEISCFLFASQLEIRLYSHLVCLTLIVVWIS